jgi:hypothetical protein
MTVAGLARRFTEEQWHAVETGIGDIHTAMLLALSPRRVAALCERVTIDLMGLHHSVGRCARAVFRGRVVSSAAGR